MMVKFNVKQHVKDRDWSIAQFAREARISYPTAHAIYHGSALRVDLSVLSQIVEALGVGVEEVLIYQREEATAVR